MLIIMFCFHLFFRGFAFCLCFCDFPIGFQNCSDSVVFFVFLFDFGIVQAVWYLLFFYQILELFRQCGICCFSIRFWNCSDKCGICCFSIRFWNCSNYGICCFSIRFWNCSEWYLLFFYQILELFRQCGIWFFSIRFWNCSDSVVFVVFLLDFGIVQTVWYCLFFYQIV